MKNTHPLPDKLSELILVALEDLEKAEKHPDYHVDMGLWHCPNGRCSVCFAGSVMAFGLGVSHNSRAYPSDFSPQVGDKLSKLNYIRAGIVPMPEGDFVDFGATEYERNPERWKTEMVLTAAALSQLGL